MLKLPTDINAQDTNQSAALISHCKLDSIIQLGGFMWQLNCFNGSEMSEAEWQFEHPTLEVRGYLEEVMGQTISLSQGLVSPVLPYNQMQNIDFAHAWFWFYGVCVCACVCVPVCACKLAFSSGSREGVKGAPGL